VPPVPAMLDESLLEVTRKQLEARHGMRGRLKVVKNAIPLVARMTVDRWNPGYSDDLEQIFYESDEYDTELMSIMMRHMKLVNALCSSETTIGMVLLTTYINRQRLNSKLEEDDEEVEPEEGYP